MSAVLEKRTRPVVVHEAEVQRQHARFKLPLRVIIDGVPHKAADWSMGGVGVLGVAKTFEPGTVLPIQLIFPLDGYDLTVDLEAEVRYQDSAIQRTGMRFVGTDPRRQAMMRHILESFVAGDLTDVGDVLEVARRQMTAPPRKQSKGAAGPSVGIVRRLFPVAMLAAITGGVIWLIGSNIYDRTFVIAPKTATIAGDSFVVSAPVDGQIGNLVTAGTVQTAQPLLTLKGANGEPLPVASPCDCEVLKTFAAEGEYVRARTPLAIVSTADSRQYVAADVSAADLPRLFRGARVTVEFLDGFRTSDARIVELPAVVAGAGVFTVRIDPGVDITRDRIGEPVLVRFDTSPLVRG